MNKWLKRTYKVLSLFGVATGVYVCYDAACVALLAMSPLLASIFVLIGLICVGMNFVHGLYNAVKRS